MASQPEITFHKRIAAIPALEFLLEQSQEGIQILRQKSIEVAREKSAQLPIPPQVQERVDQLKARVPELQQRANELKDRIPELKDRAVELAPKSIPELKERALQIRERVTVEYSERRSAYLELLKERVLPFIAAFDAFVHKQLDNAEEKYPFWLQASGPEIFKFLQERRVEVTNTVTATFEEKVKVPAISFGKELDERSKPIVDLIESKIPAKIDQSGTKFQYERALRLGEAVKDQAVVLSTEQLKQLREKNPALDRSAKTVTDTAATVSQLRERLPALPTVENVREIPLIVRATIDEKIQPVVLEKVEQVKALFEEKVRPVLEEKARPVFEEKILPLVEQAKSELEPLLEIYKAEAPLKEKISRAREHAVTRSAPFVDLARSQLVNWLDIAKAKIAA